MKDIKNKTLAMKRIEERYEIPIEILLHKLYIIEDKSHVDVGKELNTHYMSIMTWLHKAGIYSKRLHIKQPKKKYRIF